MQKMIGSLDPEARRFWKEGPVLHFVPQKVDMTKIVEGPMRKPFAVLFILYFLCTKCNKNIHVYHNIFQKIISTCLKDYRVTTVEPSMNLRALD